MELDFDGISATKLKEITDNMNLKADIYPSKRHGPVCTRERGYYDSPASQSDDSCFCAYYYCYGYNCGSYRRRSRSGCSSRGNNDCSGSDGGSGEAIVILLVIIVLVALIIIFLPEIVAVTVIGIELGLAVIVAIFDLITFGVFRNRFYRTSIHFHSEMNTGQEKDFIRNVVQNGGLPKNYLPEYQTIGFTIFRWGAYLFVPSMIGVLLIVLFNPTNRFIYYTPIIAIVLSVLMIFIGTITIKSRTDAVSGK
ncbi:MAG: hypothetical protein ACW967_05235 [Candidatus Hodarchaeales archaeon]|jgi:hypothetical protein